MSWRSSLLILLLIGSACREPAPKTSVGSTRAKPAQRPPAICPLTGSQARSGFDRGRPALAIKIDNSSAARPQAGLESADVVYEELAEGGITRFMAIFQCSDASRVGPVRSSRLVDPDILRDYAPALFGYSGGNVEVLRKIRSTQGIVDLPETRNGKAYERVRGRPAPHDLFTSTDKLRARSDVRGAPKIGLVFLKEAPTPLPTPAAKSSSSPSGSAASPSSASPSPSTTPTGSAVAFSFAGSQTIRYVYDAAGDSYLRFVAGKAFRLENRSQVAATNLVILKVKVEPGHIQDAAGNFSPEISVVGAGEAFVLYAGRALSVRWTRSSLTSRMRLVDSAGRDVPIAPGNTWIHLLPSDRPVTLE